MSTISNYQFGEVLSEDYGQKVDVTGRLGDYDSNRERVRSMLDKVVSDYLPDDERIDHLAVVLDPWHKPKVTVWCKSQGFDYSNSQVHNDRFMTHGRSYDMQIDVRPF